MKQRERWLNPLERTVCSFLAFGILFSLTCGFMRGAEAMARWNDPPPQVSLFEPLELDEFRLPEDQLPHDHLNYDGGAFAENYMTPDECWTILLTDLSPEILSLYRMEGEGRVKFAKVKYSLNQLETAQQQINRAIAAQAPDLFKIVEQSSLAGDRQSKLPLKGAVRPAEIDIQKNKVIVQGDIELLEQSFAQCRTIPADMVEIRPILPQT